MADGGGGGGGSGGGGGGGGGRSRDNRITPQASHRSIAALESDDTGGSDESDR